MGRYLLGEHSYLQVLDLELVFVVVVDKVVYLGGHAVEICGDLVDKVGALNGDRNVEVAFLYLQYRFVDGIRPPQKAVYERCGKKSAENHAQTDQYQHQCLKAAHRFEHRVQVAVADEHAVDGAYRGSVYQQRSCPVVILPVARLISAHHPVQNGVGGLRGPFWVGGEYYLSRLEIHGVAGGLKVVGGGFQRLKKAVEGQLALQQRTVRGRSGYGAEGGEGVLRGILDGIILPSLLQKDHGEVVVTQRFGDVVEYRGGVLAPVYVVNGQI